ncbi:RNase H domain-containing protein [Trichonephila clavipes]|nr:RNase H domain-containing protein [Trichonephila clavipes]
MYNDILDDLENSCTSITQVNEEPLTYIELHSKYKASINISLKQPPQHLWYFSQCPVATISFKGDRRDQTTFARLSTGHLNSFRFFHGAKTFNICTKCNDAVATEVLT